MILGGQAEKFAESAAIKALHGASVEPQRFGGDHQILTGQRCTLRRPFEYGVPKQRRHPHRLPQMH